jgi:cysteine desulfurase/selenocysteine lyase
MSLTVPASGEFPVLEREGIAYLDSAATSQTPRSVIEAMDRYYLEARATVHRSTYPLAAEATELFEGARNRVAAFTGSSPASTIFTRNATEALNLVAWSWGRTNLAAGDRIALTEMEHHSNIVPWQMVAAEKGAVLDYVDITDDGVLDLASLDAVLARGPKIIAVAHVSNVLSTVNPIEEIVRRAHDAGAVVVVDGAQAVPHLPVDVAALGADFYAWTGHKAYGPTGIGVLHGRTELLEAMPPWLGGGHMIKRVGRDESTYLEPPARFEAGTSNIAEAIGLGAAVDFLGDIGMDEVRAHGREIAAYALERVGELDDVTVYGPADVEQRGGALAFNIEGAHPHDVSEILGREGVCIRAGHHCAQPLMRRLGVAATSRASFAVHTTREDVDRLVDALASVRSVFG